jgi:hypothetical protein
MKIKTTTIILTAVFAIAMNAASAYSQNHFSGPRNMGPVLNSPSNEQGGAIAPNGLSFYFTSNRPGGLGGQDIYVSQRAALGAAWEAPQHLGATLNSSGDELLSSFSRDGRSVFFTSDRGTGTGLHNIYLSTRTDPNNDFGWTTPVNLGLPVNTEFSERGATYFEDPVTGACSLIFSREFDPTMQPFHDLYQSTRNPDGTFNSPTVIAELNTIGSETRTAISRDGLEIFIQTARPGGLGSPPPAPATFDLFVSTRASTSSPWDTSVLVPSLNTISTEGGPGLSPDGSMLYFNSNRPGGFGGNDLYSATRCSLYSDSPCAVNRTVADFDADGITDISVFHPTDGTWWVMNSDTDTVVVRQFGTSGDLPVAGDYDGDNRLDLAIFRPSTGYWWILASSTTTANGMHWGVTTDKPVPGDYDGDGKTDIAVFRDGTWYILRSSDGGFEERRFGGAEDVPIPN